MSALRVGAATFVPGASAHGDDAALRVGAATFVPGASAHGPPLTRSRSRDPDAAAAAEPEIKRRRSVSKEPALRRWASKTEDADEDLPQLPWDSKPVATAASKGPVKVRRWSSLDVEEDKEDLPSLPWTKLSVDKQADADGGGAAEPAAADAGWVEVTKKKGKGRKR